VKDINNLNYNWKVSYEEKINYSIDSLWDLISSPSNLELFHPFCKSNTIKKWPGKNSIDVLVYLNGLTYVRKFYSWKKHKGYSLFIGEKNKGQSYVIWEIYNKNESQFLKITVHPYFLRSCPSWISYIPYKFVVIPALESYLKSVIGGINYYLRTKSKIPKNYFGTHKWFS